MKTTKSDVASQLVPAKALAKNTGTRSTELPEGVIDVGAAIQSALPGLEKAAERFKQHCADIREQMKEVAPMECLDHPEVNLPVDWEATFGKSWQQDKLTPIYGPCPKCMEERGVTIVNDRWIRMGIPHKVLHATLENFVTDDATVENAKARRIALEKMKRQLKADKGFIILLGKFGTGKSHLSAAALKTKGGIFTTMADLIGALRQTYSDNTGADEFIEKYRRAPIMVLDEVTTEVKGVDIAPLLYRILAFRYDLGLLTIITSNETKETVLEILGGRLVDRIRESYVVANFTWESARKAT